MSYRDWILKQCGQVTLLVSQINFNKQIVSSLNSADPFKALTASLDHMIETINTEARLISKELPNYKVLTIEALLTIEVHSRDVLQDLISNNVSFT